MAGGDGDGYGDYGGGGSVVWEVKVGDGEAATVHQHNTKHGKRSISTGVDKYTKEPGDDPGYFLVNIEKPRVGDIKVKQENGRVEIYLRVNPSDPNVPYKPQISVRWGIDKVDPAATSL